MKLFKTKEKTKNSKELSSKKDDNREYHFAYFIESHDKSKSTNIYFSSDYKDSDTLEHIGEKDLSIEKESLVTNLYRFNCSRIILNKIKKKEKLK